MGLLNPTQSDLLDLGLSRESYMNNLIYVCRVAGTVKWKKTYTVVVYLLHNLLLMSLILFTIGAFGEGDKPAALQTIQNIGIQQIIYFGTGAFYWYHDDFMTILRIMDREIYDYEGTLDEELEEELKAIKKSANKNKKSFARVYAVIQVIICIGLSSNRPILYLLRDPSDKSVDGENNLVRRGAFFMYMPFASHWLSYYLAITFTILFLIVLDTAYMAYISTCLFISEDLLSELSVVDRTLNECVSRAEKMFNRQFQDYNFVSEEKRRDAINRCLDVCVTKSIMHHQQTLKLFNLFKKILTWPLFIMFLGWAVMVCMSVYLLLSDELTLFVKLPLVPLFLSELVVALLICYYCDLIKSAFERLGRSIYEGEGLTRYSLQLQPYISMMISFSHVQTTLTAGGFGDVDMKMFCRLCSSAYSFMGFLAST